MPGTKTAYPARPMPGRCVYWRPTRNGDWLTTRGQALTTEPSGSSSSSSEDPAEEQALARAITSNHFIRKNVSINSVS
ncbi:uncharacterized protein Dana_GF27764, isoform B [Drosophila ananassae]|uniref:Uncharacterized protein, isoform B n=1 Tax=Drosophila ananassae TaxID=7217 RepID=A0A0P8XKL7_DROAN|nr:uncharacterized protein Dana_GF27764, isoform B [Drosophila ananassae]